MTAKESSKKPVRCLHIYRRTKEQTQKMVKSTIRLLAKGKKKLVSEKRNTRSDWLNSRLSAALILAIAIILSTKITTTACTLQQTNGAMPGTTINQKTLEKPNIRLMVVTGYCACRQCVGEWYTDNPVKYGASGRELISGYSVATNSLPMGTIITIDGKEYRVDDRGTTGIDVYYDTHAGACSQGYSVQEVTIKGG